MDQQLVILPLQLFLMLMLLTYKLCFLGDISVSGQGLQPLRLYKQQHVLSLLLNEY